MSEAEALETGQVVEQEAEKKEEVSKENVEINTYLDFNDDNWKSVPEVVSKQAQARIAKDSREKAELNRKLEEERKLRLELEQKDFEAKRPKLVELPDPDLAVTDPEQFYQQQQEYLNAQQDNASWEQKRQEREQQQQLEAQKREQERLQRFVNNAEKVGMSFNQVNAAAEVINGQLIPEVGNYLIDHKFGPQILAELAKDPVELHMLASLNPIEAGVKLEAMANAFKASTQSNAPPPDEPIQGSAAVPAELGPPGATYE